MSERTPQPLSTGAEARISNDGALRAVVLLNGGSARPIAGTWSATSELLVTELAPRFPDLAFAEVRYRVKTWNDLAPCIEDAEAAVDLVERHGATSILLVGFSMGGGVAIPVLARRAVEGLVGLAPWIPDRMWLDSVRGKRLDFIHGTWDSFLPGIPGVSARSSQLGFERALAAGAHGTYTLIPRGLHGAALRRPSGGLLRLPQWRRWVDLTGEHVARFAASFHNPH
jgi:pimeloyl-ACP methyl ester carboxylesterase